MISSAHAKGPAGPALDVARTTIELEPQSPFMFVCLFLVCLFVFGGWGCSNHCVVGNHCTTHAYNLARSLTTHAGMYLAGTCWQTVQQISGAPRRPSFDARHHHQNCARQHALDGRVRTPTLYHTLSTLNVCVEIPVGLEKRALYDRGWHPRD